MSNSISTALNIYTDGGSRGNPGPAACAFVAKDETGKIIFQEGKFLGKATNNVAEYHGVLLALHYLKLHRQPAASNCKIHFFLDSLLVVSQLNGIYKIKDAILRELAINIRNLEHEIRYPILYSHIFREKNKDADLLVNQTLDQSQR